MDSHDSLDELTTLAPHSAWAGGMSWGLTLTFYPGDLPEEVNL